MFDRLGRGWELARQSYGVLKLDKELLMFPLLSGFACLLVLASFALPLWNSDYLQVVMEEEAVPDDPVAYILLFLFYFVNYFVIVFFNSALVACAIIRFKGGDPTISDGLGAASARLPQIVGWALVAATVGVILKIIESRSEKVGQIVAALMGMAWSAVTYFVVPVIVVEKLGPVEAVKRSLSILRRTWGEALSANFGIGFIVFLMSLLAMVPVVLGIFALGAGLVPVGVAGIVIGVLLLILLGLVSSALNAIVLGALYLYAAEGKVPGAFDEALFREAFSARGEE
jgi:hypothetical protein